MLRLLTLPAEVKEEIVGGKLTMGHARALLAADGAGRQVALAGEIVDRGLSVRDVERLTSVTSKKKRAKTGTLDLHVRALEEELCGILGTRVRLLPRGRGGVMEIHYHSNDALNRLVDQLRRSDSQHSNVL
jgi:ParB family chromosome partitioning protein